MNDRQGLEQRRLRRVRVHWGPRSHEHLALIPLFDSGYKVLGLVGLDADAEPAWYPGVPLVVEPPRMVFRSSLSDAPPSWGEVPRDLLRGTFFFDSWGALHALVPRVAGAPSLEGSVNLAGTRVGGRRVQDLVFEPALHRVRAFVLRGRWGLSERVSVLKLPALAQSLRVGPVPPLDVTALGPPPKRPEGWLSRVVRTLVQPMLTEPPRQR